MTEQAQTSSRLGGLEIDIVRHELRIRGRLIPLGGRAFDVLAALAESAGELVTKNDLMERIWPGTPVEENRLQVHISAIRRALGPDRDMLQTASGKGYRLVGDWIVQREKTLKHAAALESGSRSMGTGLSNLPEAGAELLGRGAALSDLQELLSAYRCVTLTGPGGIGKTVLALQVAHSLLAIFDGNCCLVDLASLSDPGLVPSALANVLALELPEETISATSVARAIGARKLFLLLDNCEHVIDAAADLAETVMRLCPQTSMLATSREVLRIEGEHVYRVAPLDVPAPDQTDRKAILGHAAIQLFIARVRAWDLGYRATGETLPMIAAICRHLDGIPLAIEFAAARAANLGAAQVAADLNDRFKSLTSGRRMVLARHQTLRATLDWSYDLLPTAEKRLLQCLAIFAGGFTLDAAVAVSDPGTVGAAGVMQGIANLISKSLVVLDRSTSTDRWRLLETIRIYALEKLLESGEAVQIARRHAEFFRELLAPHGNNSALHAGAADMTRYSREIDNVRAAIDWAFSPGGDATTGVVLTAAYVPVWLHMMLVVECRERAEQALDSLAAAPDLDARLSMHLHIALGTALLQTTGIEQRTWTTLRRALEIAEALDEVDSQLRTLWAMWSYKFNNAEHRATKTLAERFLRSAGRKGDRSDILVGDHLLGTSLHYAGRQAEAKDRLTSMVENYVPPDDQRHRAWFHHDQRLAARMMLARVLCMQGFLDQAKRTGQAVVDESRATEQTLSLRYAVAIAAIPIAIWTEDLAMAQDSIAMVMDFDRRHLPVWQSFSISMKGILLVKRGEFAEGTALLRATADKIGFAFNLAVLAEGLAGLGRHAEAASTIDQAIEHAGSVGDLPNLAEMMRMKGEILLGQECGDLPAENCFAQAIALAREQGCLLWELRAAISLARLRMGQNRHDEARDVLTPVYSRFVEGFETPNLLRANALLRSLALLD